MVKYCNNCGVQLRDEDEFCSECGFQLKKRSTEVVRTKFVSQESDQSDKLLKVKEKEDFQEEASGEGSDSKAAVIFGVVFILMAILLAVDLFIPDLFGQLGTEFGRLGTEFGRLGGEFGRMGGEFGREMGELGGSFGHFMGDWSQQMRLVAQFLLICVFIIPGAVLLLRARKGKEKTEVSL